MSPERLRPRIGVVSSRSYEVDTRVRRQAEALVAHGYAVDVICPRYPGESPSEQVGGATVWRVGSGKYQGRSLARYVLSYARFFLAASMAVTRLQRRLGLAAVHVYSMPEALVLTALAPRLAGVPLIYDAGDLTTELYAAKFGARSGGLVAGVLRLQERLGLGLADLVVTVHEEYRRRLLARGVPAERLRVVMNLPDERLFHRGVRADAPSLATFTLVYHGSLVERYGVDLAVRAVAHLRQRIPELRLRIYGDGDLRPRLVELIEALRLADRVYLSPGLLPAEQLPPILAAADLGIVPNRSDAFMETILPNKLLEYLALGMPAVVTRTRTTQAHVPEDVVEYCLPDDVDDLARAIERVWADPAYRRRLSERALAFSAAHRWSDQAATYCAAVDALVAARTRRGRLIERGCSPC